ncbi:hypothetical protein P5V15_001656 [Pogonomyrmex californicus]
MARVPNLPLKFLAQLWITVVSMQEFYLHPAECSTTENRRWIRRVPMSFIPQRDRKMIGDSEWLLITRRLELLKKSKY